MRYCFCLHKKNRCLRIDVKMVEQVMEFNYLRLNITSSGNLVKVIKTQAEKHEWLTV
jgi:hypothetical protein